MAIRTYEDLVVYQESYKLVLEIHQIAKRLPIEEKFELAPQIRRSAMSIPTNIAEGYGRKNSEKEFKHFLRNAMGSVNEVKVYIDMMKDFGYIDTETHKNLKSRYETVSKQLYRLIEKWVKTASDI